MPNVIVAAIIPVSGSVHNGSPGTWIRYTLAENLEYIRYSYSLHTQYAFEYFDRDYSEPEPSEYDDYDDGDSSYGHAYW